MIELYHWEPVSHSARVLICLAEIGIEFKSHYVDLIDFQQFSDEFLALNPLGQVPVLRNGDAILTESALINEYLAETFPDAGLAATGPQAWYDTITWSKFIDYNLSSSLATLGCRKYLTPILKVQDQAALNRKIDSIAVAERKPGWQTAANGDYGDDQIENSKRKVQLVVERMENALDDVDWLAGDSYSIADIDTFAMIRSLTDLAGDLVNEKSAPNTMAWLKRIEGRPAVASATLQGTRFEAGRAFAPGPEHSRWG